MLVLSWWECYFFSNNKHVVALNSIHGVDPLRLLTGFSSKEKDTINKMIIIENIITLFVVPVFLSHTRTI